MRVPYFFPPYLSFLWKGWGQIQFATFAFEDSTSSMYLGSRKQIFWAEWAPEGTPQPHWWPPTQPGRELLSSGWVSDQPRPWFPWSPLHTQPNIPLQSFPPLHNVVNVKACHRVIFVNVEKYFTESNFPSLVPGLYALQWCMNHVTFASFGEIYSSLESSERRPGSKKFSRAKPRAATGIL